MPRVCSQSGDGEWRRAGEMCLRKSRERERVSEREKHIKEQIVNISRFIWPIVK